MEIWRAAGGGTRASDGAGRTSSHNLLYYGDNLEVLRKYGRDESVDLCYMDPPFNSKRNYNQIYNNVGSDDLAQAQAFVDTWKWDQLARAGYTEILANAHGRFPAQMVALIRGLHRVLGEGSLFAYLVGMSLRLVEIHRCLKRTGSFYLHCDPTASHYLRLVLDSIYCSQGGDFRNEIIWKRTGAHNSADRYGPVHDVVLFYRKSESGVWNPQLQSYSEKYEKKFSKIDEKTGKRFRDVTLEGPGVRQGDSGKPWRGIDPTAKGRHWQPATYVYKKYKEITGEELGQYPLLQRLDLLDKVGMIYWPKKPGGVPAYKLFRDGAEGVPLADVWTDIDAVNSMATERLGYPTQKPVALLERIILSSSDENDVLLDPCCGCGTTIAASQKLGRRWIGIDITYQSISLILQRLEDQAGPSDWPNVEARIVLSGIPRDMESAKALAHKRDDRVRKEFEKWAVLTYTNNRGVINDKKGADAGIDGRVYFLTSATDNAVMVLQVKSGIVDRGDIAKLRGDMEREGAAMATLITFAPPTSAMVAEARAAGFYDHELMGRQYDRIQIVMIREIIEDGRRLDIPLVKDPSKAAPRAKRSPEVPPMLPGLDGPVETEERPPEEMLEYLKKATSKASYGKRAAASRVRGAKPPVAKKGKEGA
jgi:DNA modification methylase